MKLTEREAEVSDGQRHGVLMASLTVYFRLLALMKSDLVQSLYLFFSH